MVAHGETDFLESKESDRDDDTDTPEAYSFLRTIEPCPPYDREEYKRELKEKKQQKRTRRMRRFMGALAISSSMFSVGVNAYWQYDVMPARERLANTQPEIVQTREALHEDIDDTAVVVMAGLGNGGAEHIANSLITYDRIGNVWALNYDPSGIDTEVIADTIIEKAEEDDIDSLLLSGHSMGGLVALEVGNIISDKTDIELLGIVLDCTPSDLDAVRPEERRKGEIMLRALKWIPGARESRSARYFVELAARNDRWYRSFNEEGGPSIDLDALEEASDEVIRDKINNPDAATNGLIESQFEMIVASGADRNVRGIFSNEGAIPFFYITPENEQEDRVVDVGRSKRRFNDLMDEKNKALKIVKIPGIGHASPAQHPKEYNSAIIKFILPHVSDQQETILKTSAAPK